MPYRPPIKDGIRKNQGPVKLKLIPGGLEQVLLQKNDDIFSSPVFLSTTLLKKCVGRRPSSLPGQRIT